MTNYAIGQTLSAKKQWVRNRYGATATVTGVQRIVTSRKLGTTAILIDLQTASGVQIQWRQRDVTAAYQR